MEVRIKISPFFISDEIHNRAGKWYFDIECQHMDSIMPIIKPISDLKNKSSETYRIAKDSDEPIFRTKNGEGHLVLMSMEYYNKKESQSFFEGKLLEAENAHIDDEGIPLESVFSDIRARLKK